MASVTKTFTLKGVQDMFTDVIQPTLEAEIDQSVQQKATGSTARVRFPAGPNNFLQVRFLWR
jgi:hypothetical protein